MTPEETTGTLEAAIDGELFSRELGQKTVTIEAPGMELDPYLVKLLDGLSSDFGEPEGLTDLQAVGVAQGRAIEQSGLMLQLMGALNSPRLAAQLVNHLIGEEASEQVAPIIGVSAPGFIAWREGELLTFDPERLTLVAQALAYSRAGRTSSGLVFMFHNPLPQLDQRSMIEVMDSGDEDAADVILRFCRRGRAQ